MLSELSGLRHGYYGFRFQNGPENPAAGLFSVGYELQTSNDYSLNNKTRRDGPKYIFQYTLSGSGYFEAQGAAHTLVPGDAFITCVPEDSRYFLPKASKGWEFVYVSLYGSETAARWPMIAGNQGQVRRYTLQSPVITELLSICRMAQDNEITDGYQASALAYKLLMELCRGTNEIHAEFSQPVRLAVNYIKNEYPSIGGTREIAEQAGLSEFHFVRLFSEQIGIPPLKYLRKVRLEKAAELLCSTELEIDAIAGRVGYANGNYFIKVFRSCVGITPGEFRRQRRFSPCTSLKL